MKKHINQTKRLLRLGLATCMLLLITVICHTDTVFAKNFEMDPDSDEAIYTVTEAKDGTVKFGELMTTGDIYVGQKPHTFIVKNKTDKVLQIGMYVATEKPITMCWNAEFGPALIDQTITSTSQAVFTGTLVKPGEQTYVEYYLSKANDPALSSKPRLKVIVYITVRDDIPVTKKIVTKAPKIEVTKISADKVGIQVDINNHEASVAGSSKIFIYKGSKKIKTIKSDSKDLYTFTYKAKGAGSAKYKAKVVSNENKKDNKTSKEVSPKANKYTVKVNKNLKSYEPDDVTFVTESISYSGSTLIVKGYSVNTMGFDLAMPFYTSASYPSHLLYSYQSPQNKVIKKGIHKYSFKIKNAPIVDLRHCGLHISE